MYIKAMLFAGVACCGSSLWAFSSVITDTKTEQDEQTGAVTVTYKLTGEDAVVTADVQTNSVQNKAWASIGPANYTGMTGDLWKKVTADGSVRTISWPTLADGETRPPKFDKHVRVVLTAWSTNAPPDYLVINLNYNKSTPPAYYTDEALLPEGGSVTNKAYKEDQLVLKRMHAAGVTWMMSNDYVAKQGINTVSCRRSSEIAHPVMLTHDYYIGVFEITEAQNAWIRGSATIPDSRVAAKGMGFWTVRGSSKGTKFPSYKEDGSFDWETSYGTDDGYFVYYLRRRTKFPWIDIPTEAQWEFAARAGSRGVYYSGVTLSNLGEYARYSSNKGQADCEGKTGSIATVGSFKPNAFGLYDMIGNLAECTLDRVENWSTCNNGGPIDANEVWVDPVGAKTGTNRCYAGGMYDWGDGYTYIGRRWDVAPEWSGGYYGVRVCLTLR